MKIKLIKGKGRGVISGRNYAEGEIVEVCPVLVLSKKEWKALTNTGLNDYVFSWPSDKQPTNLSMDKWGAACVCFGYGSLYNHDSDANMSWKIRRKNKQLIFFAIKRISVGEELTHDYSWPEDKYSSLGIK